MFHPGNFVFSIAAVLGIPHWRQPSTDDPPALKKLVEACLKHDVVPWLSYLPSVHAASQATSVNAETQNYQVQEQRGTTASAARVSELSTRQVCLGIKAM